MKKIINGRKYDTNSATLVASVNNGNNGDFGHWSESLYIKKNNEFFLYGEGGPMTIYGRELEDNSRGYGESITPLNESEAKAWLEENGDCDIYENYFGIVEE